MAIWVHIAPIIEPQSDETKTALTGSLKTAIERKLVSLVGQALPPDKFDVKPENKPKRASQTFNAIKVTSTLKLTIEVRGNKTTVTCKLHTDFEAIKVPELKKGAELILSGSRGAAADNRGTDEVAITAITEQCLLEIVAPLVKKIIETPTFTSYGRSKGLPL